MPEQECTCAAEDEVKAVYPDWATADDITAAEASGKQNWAVNTAAAQILADEEAAAAEAAETEGNTDDTTETIDPTEETGETGDVTDAVFVWPTCEADLTCGEGFYLNKLACNCFASSHCNDLTCGDG